MKQISSLIKPEAVRVFGAMPSKKRLFQELGEVAQLAYGLPSDKVVTALQEREALGPTGVGDGVALPHARLADIETVSCAFVRLEKAIDYGAVDRKPVDLVFALFAPLDSGVDHLKALARVARMLRDATVCSKLRANADPATLHAVLIEAQASNQAA